MAGFVFQSRVVGPPIHPRLKVPRQADDLYWFMGEEPLMQAGTSPEKIPAELNIKLRSLAHDLSNSIETIMQASYLLAQGNLTDANKKWLELIDNASRDAARINREIREILRSQTEDSK